MGIVSKTLQDLIPKVCMHIIVNNIKTFIQEELIAHLYRMTPDELMEGAVQWPGQGASPGALLAQLRGAGAAGIFRVWLQNPRRRRRGAMRSWPCTAPARKPWTSSRM